MNANQMVPAPPVLDLHIHNIEETPMTKGQRNALLLTLQGVVTYYENIVAELRNSQGEPEVSEDPPPDQ